MNDDLFGFGFDFDWCGSDGMDAGEFAELRGEIGIITQCKGDCDVQT